jgi:asparagine synthase (glutamine-hydrolysing)
MCGIAGALFDSIQSTTADHVVGRMVRVLGHRGPDGSGLVRLRQDDGSANVDVAVGHTRLAILDLSERGAQPMRDEADCVTITYNGEIYNFVELRCELERRGRRFRSHSDTEVILEGYREWGDDVVSHLRGMFAFALWDADRGRFLIARDRLGIKPLYYVERHGQFLFASEVRALLASGLVSPTIDSAALDQYLAYQTTATPRTLVRDVRMLEPGHLLTKSAGRPGVSRVYWDFIGSTDRSARTATADAATDRVSQLLEEAVRLHLVSDVPVGVFLSGGIDSSALALFVRRAGVTPRTFTVSFPGSSADEGAFARKIAETIDADHTEIQLGESELLQMLPDAVASFDHPSGDAVNTYVVSKAVRSAGIKVALSGLGGDELFGGYASFGRLSNARTWARAWHRTPPGVRQAAAAAMRALAPSSIASEKTAAVLETDGSLPQAFPVLRQLFSKAQRRRLLGETGGRGRVAGRDPYVALLETALTNAGTLPFASRVSYAEARTYMHDVLLRDTDQMSMRHGLEVRVPLLDHELVQYVMGVSDEAKQAGGGPKPLLLRQIQADLPPECLRRPKQGFVLPFAAWMRGALRPYCEERLLGGALVDRAGLDGGTVAALWQSFVDGRPTVSWSRLWTLVALSAWSEHNGAAR